ncbi:MAG: ROK family protein [Bryobacteraceae bacterium]|nr:ROK family protein [Bryobacteraceae bacterium]
MALGVDIGGTQIKAARVSCEGEILEARKIATPDSLEAFGGAVRGLIAGLGGGPIGVGCKGIIDPATSRVDVLPGTLHYLEGQVLSELLGAKVAADNDARVALAGEHRWGAARGYQHVLMLTLGTGVGGGVISHGRLLRGASGVAGHIGHLTIDPAGAPCICGNRGCLETVFSSRAIEAQAFSAVHRGVASRLGRGAACADVFALAAQGDLVAADIVFEATYKLAAAVAGLVMVFDPEVIVIGGQIAAAGEQLLDPLRQEIHARTRLMLRRDVPVIATRLSDPSGVLGAAALALDASVG